MPRFSANALESLARSMLAAAGATADESMIVASHLVRANLVGHDSHGFLRILQYVADIEAGRVRPGSIPRVLSDWPTGAALDADGVFGQVACRHAMELAIEKAEKAGLAAVGVKRSQHSGRLGDYIEEAAKRGLVAWAFANGGGGGQWVAPFGGRERRLSTNPLAFAVPTNSGYPLLVDVSTSVVPEGKIRDLRLRGAKTPPGWLVNAEGEPTDDPGALYESPVGAILPLGGTAGHKGSALAFMVDVLAGGLARGGVPTKERASLFQGSGVFLIALDVRRFLPIAELKDELTSMIDYVTSSKPAAGFTEVMAPGEMEHRMREARLRDGIDIPPETWSQVQALADRLERVSGKSIDRPTNHSMDELPDVRMD